MNFREIMSIRYYWPVEIDKGPFASPSGFNTYNNKVTSY